MKLISYLGLSAVLISHSGYASLTDCLQAGQAGNSQEAIKTCLPYANSSMGALGMLFASYAGVHQPAKSIEYAQKYIDRFKRGDDVLLLASAYTMIGNYYYFGEGVPKNVEEGLGNITKGAELGSVIAQKQLGDIYASNKTISQNLSVAYQWYEIANLNGDDEAKRTFLMSNLSDFKKELPLCLAMGQDNVGQAYYKGIGGLTQSNSDALEWMQKAADTDPTLSVTNLDLAKMYHNTGDDSKAFEYAQKATTQPLAPAMQYLGYMYREGVGTNRDPVKAYAYLTLAVDLYNNPDTDFWNKFAAPCMPNYETTADLLNAKVQSCQTTT